VSCILKVVHEAGDFLDISDPLKLTVEHLGITLPVRNDILTPSGSVLLGNSRKFDSILLNAEDEQRVLAYANRGYEIAGTVNGRIMMRKAL
jgi:hypothetical protein